MSGSLRIRFAVLPAALAALALIPASASAQRDQLNVPWTFDAGANAQGAAPNSAPAGSNDFHCKPSKAHPRPVVLAHGLLANRTVNWATMSPLLANRGYCVFALTYGRKGKVTTPFYQPGGLKPMQRSAHELKRFVNKVLRRTDARKVDIVGHSEGSLMPNYYVKFLGGRKVVKHYVGMTPLWDGTNTAGLASVAEISALFGLDQTAFDTVSAACSSCPQFLHGSKFLKKMNRGPHGAAVPSVKYTMLMTKNDELVVPYTSGRLSGKNVNNIVLQDECPTAVPGVSSDQSEHVSVAADPNVATFILNALGHRNKKPPCFPVLPGIGAPGYSGNP